MPLETAARERVKRLSSSGSPGKERAVPLLEVVGLAVRYQDVPVLDDVSLSVNDGAVVAVVGPNGSGKTTLLRALFGAVPRRSGQVLLRGESIDRLSRRDLAKEIAVVHQDMHLDFDFSVEEIVMLGRSPHQSLLSPDSEVDRRIVDEALHEVDLWPLRRRSVATLSGGERQRVQLARALAQRPALMLLDEPTNHLDTRARLDMLHLVRAQGISVLAVLHDLNLVSSFASEVVVLHRGRRVAVGAPKDVLSPRLLEEVFGVSVEVVSAKSGDPVLIFGRRSGSGSFGPSNEGQESVDNEAVTP